MEIITKLVGRRVILTEGEDHGRSVQATLVDRWLVVSDNHQCGGLKANLDGVYLKQ